MAQQVAAPRQRRTALIVVALLLFALSVGAVTAVNLFPARASRQAADEWTRVNEFRAGERASLTQAADEWTRVNEFRAGERASLGTGAWPGPLGRLDNGASVLGTGAWPGPLGRLDNGASVAGTGAWPGPLGR